MCVSACVHGHVCTRALCACLGAQWRNNVFCSTSVEGKLSAAPWHCYPTFIVTCGPPGVAGTLSITLPNRERGRRGRRERQPAKACMASSREHRA